MARVPKGGIGSGELPYGAATGCVAVRRAMRSHARCPPRDTGEYRCFPSHFFCIDRGPRGGVAGGVASSGSSSPDTPALTRHRFYMDRRCS